MVYCEAKRILLAYENKQGSIQSLISQSQCQVKSPHYIQFKYPGLYYFFFDY